MLRLHRNSKEEWGCYLTIWDAGHYHMISVSHVDDVPTRAAIADALVSPPDMSNKMADTTMPRDTRLLATVKSGDHWYMVSVSDMLQPYHKQWWLERIS